MGAILQCLINALLEGIVHRGYFLWIIPMPRYPGIVIQATALTFGTLAAMLFLHKTGIIKVTEQLRMGIMAGKSGGIALFYLVTIVYKSFLKFMYRSCMEIAYWSIGFSIFAG